MNMVFLLTPLSYSVWHLRWRPKYRHEKETCEEVHREGRLLGWDHRWTSGPQLHYGTKTSIPHCEDRYCNHPVLQHDQDHVSRNSSKTVDGCHKNRRVEQKGEAQDEGWMQLESAKGCHTGWIRGARGIWDPNLDQNTAKTHGRIMPIN